MEQRYRKSIWFPRCFVPTVYSSTRSPRLHERCGDALSTSSSDSLSFAHRISVTLPLRALLSRHARVSRILPFATLAFLPLLNGSLAPGYCTRFTRCVRVQVELAADCVDLWRLASTVIARRQQEIAPPWCCHLVVLSMAIRPSFIRYA